MGFTFNVTPIPIKTL